MPSIHRNQAVTRKKGRKEGRNNLTKPVSLPKTDKKQNLRNRAEVTKIKLTQKPSLTMEARNSISNLFTSFTVLFPEIKTKQIFNQPTPKLLEQFN